jgi:hypothetical protein
MAAAPGRAGNVQSAKAAMEFMTSVMSVATTVMNTVL